MGLRFVPMLFLAVFGGFSSARAIEPPLFLTPVASGLSNPVFVASAPGDASKLFVVEQTGAIRVIQNGTLLSTPFLDISSLVTYGGERGLLGLAFDPNYETNGRFYVDYVDTSGNTQVSRYQVSSNPLVANPASATRIISVAQPFENHKGGWLGFGRDNNLYVATGDGGSGNDPQNNAQNKSSLLGKILRLDVNRDDFPADTTRNYGIPSGNPFATSGGAPEVFDYGLRNPWRNSFDRATGDLYIGDVGQGEREEISLHRAGTPGGLNFGWVPFEGTRPTSLGSLAPGSTPIPPIYEYDHSGGGIAVTGGYVYRGSGIEGLSGAYFFADYKLGRLWSFRYENGVATDFQDRSGQLGTVPWISSFGEDAQGELYVVTITGSIYKLGGRIFGDANNDGRVTGADYTIWAANFHKAGDFNHGDFNGDGQITGADYTLWASHFQGDAAAAVVVPEPATIVTLGLGILGMLVLGRKRLGGRANQDPTR